MSPLANGSKRLERFFFAPASPRPLGWLRIGLCGTLLLQAWLVGGEVFQLYGHSGWLQGALGNYFGSTSLPGIGAVLDFASAQGITEHTAIAAVAGLYVLSLVASLVGWQTRIALTVALLTHFLLTGGQITSYGVDQYAGVFLFYLLLSPCGHALSLDAIAQPKAERASSAARFFLRAMQLHLCLTYFFAGADKAMGAQWWNGEAIWRALMLPIYCPYHFEWLAQVPWLARLMTWGTLVVEMGYAVMIWSRRTRPYWIAAALGMHFGIAVFMGLGTFSLAMSVLTLSLFGASAEPATVTLKPFSSPFRTEHVVFQPVL